MPLPLDRAPSTYPELVAAWASAIEPFADLAESLTEEQWLAPSILPGWTNADIVAHVVGIERDLLGQAEPYRELAWEQLPHADDLFSRYTELAVASRRGVPQHEVCAELRAAIAARRAFLDKQSPDLGEIVSGPGGWELPRGVVMRMRCFDIWVHEQDIRASIGEPGGLDSDAAWVAAGQMLKGLGRVWAREVGAQPGQSAEVIVTGPGVSFHAGLLLDGDGRGRVVGAGEVPTPTTSITLTWPHFTAAACGRVTAQGQSAAINGDVALGQQLIASLNIAP